MHAVAACVCDAGGVLRFSAGSVDEPVFTRSALKPFIAAAVVRSGAADRFGLDDRDLAIMSASHSAEPVHREAATAVLMKAGATVADLRCGTPDGRASALWNNCSGKHAGILVLARALDAPFATYLELDHPAQRAILGFCEEIFGEPLRGDRLGVDGCGIPNVAVSLQRLAAAFARLAKGDSAELRRVRDAMRTHPHLVAGTGRVDTDLGSATGGRIVAKAGAEGVHGFAIVDRGLGAALKIADGARRADGPAAVALLEAAGALDAGERAALAHHARTPVRNVAGRVVGEVRAAAGA